MRAEQGVCAQKTPKSSIFAASDRPALQALVVRRRRYLAHLSPLCAAFQVGFGTSGQHAGYFGALGSPAFEFGQRELCYGMCALETWARRWSSSVHGSDASKQRTTHGTTREHAQGAGVCACPVLVGFVSSPAAGAAKKKKGVTYVIPVISAP